MPRSWKMRIFFLMYVCYCSAMSTVFQAFFVPYLVEPGYGEKIATFQELLDSSVNYGFNTAIEFVMATIEFSDHLKFPPTRRVNCANLKSCLMRMMTVGDVATISAPIYTKFSPRIIRRKEFPLFFRRELHLRKYSYCDS
jgi:hypothetical protein